MVMTCARPVELCTASRLLVKSIGVRPVDFDLQPVELCMAGRLWYGR